jgi:hypothetical protein
MAGLRLRGHGYYRVAAAFAEGVEEGYMFLTQGFSYFWDIHIYWLLRLLE